MKITGISAQARNPDRVNVSVDGKYRFSLDIFQLAELGVRVGKDYDESALAELENESAYGKLYTKSLEYCMLRPHSSREMRDYLWRKTRATKYRSRDGEMKERAGVSQTIATRVYDRLVEKDYINDEKFARWWVENRNLRKGTSRRKLQAELAAKGVVSSIVVAVLEDSTRSDEKELQKIVGKKRAKYPDEQKFIQYLARQGFSYDAIKSALSSDDRSL
ncbi:MAG: RecX family transcriptional regulator [Candidatus Saccharimonas sp.]